MIIDYQKPIDKVCSSFIERLRYKYVHFLYENRKIPVEWREIVEGKADE
jgi:hypothetical protein